MNVNLKKKILDNDLWQSTMKRQKKKKNHFLTRGKWNRGEQTNKATSFSLLFTLKHKPFLPVLLLLLLLSTLLFYLFSPSLSAWLGWCSRGPGSIVQFHTCLLYWHLSEHIFPPNISPHIILHFLYNDMLSLISLFVSRLLAMRIRIQ